MYRINRYMLDFVKQFEGLSLRPYYCPAGLPTIGYGHVMSESENYQKITIEDAENLLMQDLEIAKASVLRNIDRELTENQFTSILSFTYNLGGGALQRSSLRRKINAKEDDLVPYELNRWIFSRGKILPGLVRRRKIEGELYISL